MAQASVIVFIIDGSKGLQAADRELYTVIKNLNKPTIIAVNKVDSCKGDEAGDQLATEIPRGPAGCARVIPISTRTE